MLSGKNRFRGLGSVRRVYKNSQSIRGQQLALRYQKTNRSNFRVAIVVSKKVEKSAVKRNKIRRRIYENVRTNASRINQPHDLIISVFSPLVGSMPANELNQAVEDLLKKANVID